MKECNLNIDKRYIVRAHYTSRILQSRISFLFMSGNISDKAVLHRIR